MNARRRHPHVWAIARVVGPYAAFAGLWILLSDRLLAALAVDAGTFARLSTYKGWAFVLVTAALLAFLMHIQLRQRKRAFDRLEERVAERTRELDEARHLLDVILNNIPNPVFWKDQQLRYLGCNSSYEQAFDVKRADLVGKTVLEIDYLPLSDRNRYHEEQQRLLDEGGALRREVVMTFADGRPHNVLYSAGCFRPDGGSAGGVVAVMTDITALKETEAALAEAKRAAEAADRIKSAFLATMSHELRTPLNSIIGFTGVLLQGLAGPLSPEQGKQMTMVRDSARHLLALINDVLDISKIEAGQLELARRPFDLRASLERVAGIARPLAEAKALALRVELDPGLGSAVGDARRVEQVLLNLLSNAVKFTERGEVTLRAEPATLPGEQGSTVVAVRIAVADTGIGIRDEDRVLLFRPFRQIDSRLARQHEGTGLGLAICRRLCDAMGGTIQVQSRWQHGSTFTVTLPLGEP